MKANHDDLQCSRFKSESGKMTEINTIQFPTQIRPNGLFEGRLKELSQLYELIIKDSP